MGLKQGQVGQKAEPIYHFHHTPCDDAPKQACFRYSHPVGIAGCLVCEEYFLVCVTDLACVCVFVCVCVCVCTCLAVRAGKITSLDTSQLRASMKPGWEDLVRRCIQRFHLQNDGEISFAKKHQQEGGSGYP